MLNIQIQMKRLFVDYLLYCTHYWKEVAPLAAVAGSHKKRGVIETVKDFDVRFIQPASNSLAATRIIGNYTMLLQIMPLENTNEFVEANKLYSILMEACVKVLETKIEAA